MPLRPFRFAALLILAAVAIFALPPLYVLSSILAPWSELWGHLGESLLSRVGRDTALLLVGVTLGATALGTALGWLCGACEFPGRRWLEPALCLALALPSYVTAFVFVGALDPAIPVRGMAGAIAAFSFCLFPYVYLLALQAFRGQGVRGFETARALGYGPWRAFFKASLPMARIPLASGAVLVAMETLADFGTVSIFNLDTPTVMIYRAWFSFFSLPTALQIAALLLLATFLLVGALRRLEASAPPGASSARRPGRVRLTGAAGGMALAFTGGVFILAVVFPLGQLLAWMGSELSTQGFDRRYLGVLGSSAVLGILAAAFTVALGGIAVLYRRLVGGALGRISARVLTVGYAIPGTVLALGVFVPLAALDRTVADFIQARTGWDPGLLLTGSGAALVLGLTIRFLAIAYQPLQGRLGELSPRLEEASVSLGVIGPAMLRRVHFPLLRGSAGVAALLVFVDVIKEMPLTLMTRPLGFQTLSVRIFELTGEGLWQAASVPALFLVVLGAIPVMSLMRS